MVTIEENKVLRRLAQVQGWLSTVQAVDTEVDDLLRASSIETERLCFCGCCSKNPVLSCDYGKQVLKKLKEVEGLKTKGAFEVLAERLPAPKVEKIYTKQTVGLERILAKAWNCFMKDEVRTLGLYGMGGVGKTTLLAGINNKLFDEGGDYDIVIWVVVSQDLRIESIQKQIGERLGFDKEWIEKTEKEKASDIHNALRQKRFVLLLDDIWREVDLSKINVPPPTRENGCKVVFTTRLKKICTNMEVDDEMEVECLSWDDAWGLFQNKVGEMASKSHPDIPGLAIKVAKKCRNLPLALNVIGKAMARKITVQEWHHAINVLNSSSHEFPGMEDEILPILKYSYDNLRNEKVKTCFLYCALFPEDHEIIRGELIEYWMYEGIIDGYEDRDKAFDEGHEIISSLVSAFLLIDEGSTKPVKMHDVIREIALWIASNFVQKKETFFVKAGAGLCQVPKILNSENVRRISLMNNQIERIVGNFNCPKLTTLFLQKNKLVHISEDFFRFMSTLVVLDLSRNRSLTELPEDISNLVSLRYLNLWGTGIERLPVGLKELRKLTYLNLESTGGVEGINVISSLLNLQVLRLFYCRAHFDLSLVEELQLMEHLTFLTITLEDASVLQSFIAMHRLASITLALCLTEISASVIVFTPIALGGLRQLRIQSSNISEIKIDWEGKESEMILPPNNQIRVGTPYFQNLVHVFISNCRGLKDLTWLLFAPNLTTLLVIQSPQIEEIINREKAVGFTSGQSNSMVFEKLEGLRLSRLDELKSICWSPLPLQNLKTLFVEKCPKLRKLPLDSESAKGRHVDIDVEKEWIEGIEWEDEATKKRFFPTRFLERDRT